MNSASSINSSESLTESLERLGRSYQTIWNQVSPGIPAYEHIYDREEQVNRESRGEELITRFRQELRQQPRTLKEREIARGRFYSLVAEFAKSTLDLQDRHLAVIMRPEFTDIISCFSVAARYFDPKIRQADIIQAARNAVAMNAIQYLAGHPVSLTPAIFAYSLLYPYTDNFLDDPDIAVEAKEAFNQRFERRLAGEMLSPQDRREQAVYDLVGMIEAQYNRELFPLVFESLSFLHCAQVKSLRLLRPSNSITFEDILGISFEKGGSSVVADGYLVAGRLTADQVDFLYGLGAFLQIVDDLQDLHGDLSTGFHTIFSESTGANFLDEIVNRTFSLGTQVIARSDCFEDPKAGPLKELMAWSAYFLLEEAVGRASKFFSKEYLRQVETLLPFGFHFLEEQRSIVDHERAAIIRFAEAFSTSDNPESGSWDLIKRLIDEGRAHPR